MTTPGSDNLLAAAVIAVAGLTVALWCGAALAVAITERDLLDAGMGDAFAALLRLPRFAANPASAWSPSSRVQLPGPTVYWPCTTLAVAGIGSSALWLWLRFAAPRVGLQRRERLGVDPRSHMATLLVAQFRPMNGHIPSRVPVRIRPCYSASEAQPTRRPALAVTVGRRAVDTVVS